MPPLNPAALGLALVLALPLQTAQATPAACPQVAEQMSEHLASARQRIRADGEVRVAFDVSASGRAQLVAVQGTRAYRTPVRTAVDTLECRTGTPQRYVLDIRFAEPVPGVMAGAASATLAQLQPTEPR